VGREEWKEETCTTEVVSRGVENSGSLPTHYYKSKGINKLPCPDHSCKLGTIVDCLFEGLVIPAPFFFDFFYCFGYHDYTIIIHSIYIFLLYDDVIHVLQPQPIYTIE